MLIAENKCKGVSLISLSSTTRAVPGARCNKTRIYSPDAVTRKGNRTAARTAAFNNPGMRPCLMSSWIVAGPRVAPSKSGLHEWTMIVTPKNVLAPSGIGDRNIRIAEECDRLLRLIAWCRECLEGEIAAALGTREKHSVDKGTLSKLKEIALSFEKLADSKIRLDKSQRSMANDMTPAEEMAAVRSYLRSLGPTERGHLLKDELQWHVDQGQ